jgi:uncharacterized membrane protein
MTSVGKSIIYIGAVLVVIGVAIMLISKLTGGRFLPGDIIIRRPGFTFYFPIVTCIIVSIILTLLFRLLAVLHK